MARAERRAWDHTVHSAGWLLKLAVPRAFCQFTSKDGFTIGALLETLASEQPTLAALACYATLKYDGSTCKGSPGSCYCSQLGGTDLFGGVDTAGGGWVLKADSNDVLVTPRLAATPLTGQPGQGGPPSAFDCAPWFGHSYECSSGVPGSGLLA